MGGDEYGEFICHDDAKIHISNEIEKDNVKFDSKKMKNLMKCVAMGCMLMACLNAQAQLNLGNVVKGLSGSSSSSKTSTSSSSSSSVSSLVSGISSLFSSSKTATADKLVGTWTYKQPAVVFESDNVLSSLGGNVASSQIESNLKTKLEKYGITEGAMSMTFDNSGNFTQTISSKTLKGTYTIDGSEVVLKYSGSVKQLAGTTQLDGNSLVIVMDATKLLSYMQTLGSLSGNSTLKAASSLTSSVDGMLVGLRFEK